MWFITRLILTNSNWKPPLQLLKFFHAKPISRQSVPPSPLYILSFMEGPYWKLNLPRRSLLQRSILLQPYVRRYRIFFFKILPMRNERKLGMARWRVTDVFNNSILLLRLSKSKANFFSKCKLLTCFSSFWVQEQCVEERLSKYEVKIVRNLRL